MSDLAIFRLTRNEQRFATQHMVTADDAGIAGLSRSVRPNKLAGLVYPVELQVSALLLSATRSRNDRQTRLGSLSIPMLVVDCHMSSGMLYYCHARSCSPCVRISARQIRTQNSEVLSGVFLRCPLRCPCLLLAFVLAFAPLCYFSNRQVSAVSFFFSNPVGFVAVP